MLVVDDDFVVVVSAVVIVDDCAEVSDVVIAPDDVSLVVVAFEVVSAGVDVVVLNSKLDDVVASAVDFVPGSVFDVVCIVVEVVVG